MVVKAAHYYGVAPWLLLEQSQAWTEWALMAESAENEAAYNARKQPWSK